MTKLLKYSFANIVISISNALIHEKPIIGLRKYNKCNVLGEQQAERREAMFTAKTRYFLNDLPDYQGQPITITNDAWEKYILERATKCYYNYPVNRKNADGGLYVGLPGIAFMFYHLSKSGIFPNEVEHHKTNAQEIVRSCQILAKTTRIKNKSDESGFLIGNSGLYATAAAVYHQKGDEERSKRALAKFVACANICIPLNYVTFGGDEFLVGRAGYLAGAIWLNRELGYQAVPLDMMHKVCDSMIEYGRWYSKANNHTCPLMYSYYKTEYLGAAHGLSSILQVLMTVDSYLDNHPDAENDVRGSVDYLLSLQTPEGNFPVAMDEIEPNQRPLEDALVHWCHGAPGVIYMMAKAYLRWNDKKYLDSCIKCGEMIWTRGLIKKGPGICHGVAGNAYALLLLYRLTDDPKYLHRANQFSSFLLMSKFKESRKPDNPYSLFEGWAGTVIFLTDLLNPSTASFPFMNVF